ncbi:MAG TPA: DUF72 domain-containing protein [Bacteroidia bacterium]|jgi:uncharacterized protein YecE (DUF72 family)|nr:DUF72 domain-containing protein [Bacteroidia bacterium]
MKTVLKQLSEKIDAPNHALSIPKTIHIGCSGYYYGYWKNKFYPKGLVAKDYLSHYSTVFNSVELNGTFYRTPALSQLQKYRDATGTDFSFAVKVSKYITHVLRLNESKQHIEEFQTLIKNGLQDKAKCFLFQFPASFQFSEENLERILINIPHHKENIIEFRHISWWNNEVLREMKKANLTFCNVDFPKLESSFEQTSDVFYLRLHGNPILFKSSYSAEQLMEFQKHFPKNCSTYWIFFNNTYYEAGYLNAQELMRITSKKE